MEFKITKHLEKLAKKSLPIQKQFYPDKKEGKHSDAAKEDPFQEDNKYCKSKGFIHKYSKRALILLTTECAANCRFCTRRRNSGKQEKINKNDIGVILRYLHANKKINEIIFSGGDPLTEPEMLEYAIKKLSALKQIKIIRIHTRIPVSDPQRVNNDLVGVLKKIQQALYIAVHFEHPHELTAETINAIKLLRSTGATILSQSVFLKGINDSYDVLFDLFNKLAEINVRPYMIGHCDLIKGAEHFIVPLKKEVKIMTQLRKTLSGVAFPNHVIDSPSGCGKIIVPLNFWEFNDKKFKDFNDAEINTY